MDGNAIIAALRLFSPINAQNVLARSIYRRNFPAFTLTHLFSL